jgi:hypothetical protein
MSELWPVDHLRARKRRGESSVYAGEWGADAAQHLAGADLAIMRLCEVGWACYRGSEWRQ